jgi:Uma2 family endonuclease
MTNELFDEYCQWTPGSKIELIHGKLYIGDSLTHSSRLLSQILQGWGIDAIICLAEERLWWEALASTFDLPRLKNSANSNLNYLKNCANKIKFIPETPPHHGDWTWSYSQLRQELKMALFSSLNRSKIGGESLGGGFVNRLGNNGIMPDILAFRGQDRNQLYEYYLEGPAELLIEFLQPGCEDYFYQVKFPLYQQYQVPELWIVNPEKRQIDLLRWSDGEYQTQTPSLNDGYPISTFPELTFFPENLWLETEKKFDFMGQNLFKINTENQKYSRIKTQGDGVDFTRGLLPFKVNLEPVYINFEDYIYWCPENKFEFLNGRPYIGNKEGVKGLIGLLLMTFGLTEVVKLAHPKDWINALLKQQEIANNPNSKTSLWNVAHQTATFFKNHYNIEKIAVAGDLVNKPIFDVWSELILIVWEVKQESTIYTPLDEILQQLRQDIPIRLIQANEDLTTAESQIIAQGFIEI